MVCVNPDDTGLITLYRVYPKGTNAKAQFQKELTNPAGRADLVENNHPDGGGRQQAVRMDPCRQKDRRQIHALDELQHRLPNVAEYNRDEKDSEEVVFALKSFPMNVFVTPEIMKHVVACVHAARDEVLKDA